VNKCIVDLSLGRNDINDVVGRWGDVSWIRLFSCLLVCCIHTRGQFDDSYFTWSSFLLLGQIIIITNTTDVDFMFQLNDRHAMTELNKWKCLRLMGSGSCFEPGPLPPGNFLDHPVYGNG
jgi:hypothetical protein